MAAKVLIRCAGVSDDGETCDNILGEWIAGALHMRYRGREALVIPLTVVCELCGTTWRPPEQIRLRAVRSVADAEDSLSRAV